MIHLHYLGNISSGIYRFATPDIAHVEVSNIPFTHMWFKEVLNSAKLEKIRCIVRGSLGKFHKMWNPFYRYIRELDMPHVSVQ
ncbi:hypothetical protein F7725_025376 [Dissostichus mawsoni]|uniref:Uncharacterized protein n=1 Tax=Dissostichus mawsoni TaxID=36200 RepID=A0A7J5XAZ6_DISMA|nr:hypothetical protein F7725_025376 [Dissostichus mawsoni]